MKKSFEEHSLSEAKSRCACPVCGSSAPEGDRSVCPVCGKLLDEGYLPLDVIRSTYRMQGKSFAEKHPGPKDLFEQDKNSICDTAWACVVYSIVPYLGIIFIPFAVVTSTIGYYESIRRPRIGGRRMAKVCLSLSILVLAIQLLLWWLLYLIPQLNGSRF